MINLWRNKIIRMYMISVFGIRNNDEHNISIISFRTGRPEPAAFRIAGKRRHCLCCRQSNIGKKKMKKEMAITMKRYYIEEKKCLSSNILVWAIVRQLGNHNRTDNNTGKPIKSIDIYIIYELARIASRGVHSTQCEPLKLFESSAALLRTSGSCDDFYCWLLPKLCRWSGKWKRLQLVLLIFSLDEIGVFVISLCVFAIYYVEQFFYSHNCIDRNAKVVEQVIIYK